MDRAQKAATIEGLRTAFRTAPMVVVSHYSGLSVAEMESLRARMREAGARFQVTKNRLARIALEGTEFEGITGMMTGPTGVTFSTDPVQAAKAATAFAKENEKFIIIGGGLGRQLLDAKAIDELSKMPSIGELRAKLLGLFNQPASKLVGTMQAAPRDLLGVLAAPAPKLLGVLKAQEQKLAA